MALGLLALACAHEKVERIASAPVNPTAYAFPRAHAEVNACLRRLETKGIAVKDDYLMGITLEDGFGSYQGIFDSPENRYDVVFWNYEIDRSDVYHIEGRFLRYYADFHVHVGPPPGPPTSVTVRAINARVVIGTTWTIGHSGRANVNETVPGTTIEEYIILRAIGDCLGVRQMPSLKLPAVQHGPETK